MAEFASRATSALVSSIPTSLIGLVLEYCQRNIGTSYRDDKSVFVGDDSIRATFFAFAMRTKDGSVVSWGCPQTGKDIPVVKKLQNVKAICAAYFGGFAAIVGDDNSVICWGDDTTCFAAPLQLSELQEVEAICGSRQTFAALKSDGTMTTWSIGDLRRGDASVRTRLKGVRTIYGAKDAFAAVLDDGTVEMSGFVWLDPLVKARLKKQVQCINGNYGAFAALLSDGTVETWGSELHGGDSSAVASELTQVELICSTRTAFAALRKDGTVITWGRDGGSDSSHVKSDLTQVVALGSTDYAFAAARSDGKIVTWGSTSVGGVCSGLNEELKGVVFIRGSSGAFAALRNDGTVTTWGCPSYGGDSSVVQKELHHVVSISAIGRAFAAQRIDGTVVTWGNKGSGGVIRPEARPLAIACCQLL